MTGRATYALPAAVIGWLATLAFGVSALGLRIVRPDPIVPNIFGMGETGMVAFVILGIAWSTVGALLIVRRPNNLVGWMVLLVGAGYSLSILGAAVTSSAIADGPSSLPLARIAGWVTGLGSLLGGGVFYLAVIFPTGRGHTPRWQLAGYGLAAATVFTCIALLTQPGTLHLMPSIANPFGFGPDLRPLFAGRMASMIAIGAATFTPLLGAALVSRYRAGTAVERVQLRWFVASIVLTLSTLIAVALVGVVGADVLGELPLVALPSLVRPSRSRSASPSCAITSTTSTESSAGRSPGPCYQGCSSAPSRVPCSSSRPSCRASPRARLWRLPPLRSSRSHCSNLSAGASR